MKNTILILSLISLFSSPVLGQTESESLSCTDCHTTYIEHEVMHAIAADDCESCHMTSGNEHPGELSGFDLMDVMPTLCYYCHEEPTASTQHAPAEMGECTMCHSPHGSPNTSLLIDSPESAVCFQCHDMSIAEKEVKHYPVEEGYCSTCHDPHQSDNSFLLKQEKKQLCLECHSEFSPEEAKEYIHYPYDDDCSNCHETHSSDHKGLLMDSQANLCFTCHDMAMTDKKVKHKPMGDGECSSCHDPHQSDHYPLLKAEKKALCQNCHTNERLQTGFEYQHYPFDDDCANCHETHSADNEALLMQSTPGLCYNCHDMQTSIDTSKVIHKVVTNGKACANCHSPHASKEPYLLLDTGKDLCLDCHSRTISLEDRQIENIGASVKTGNTVHGVIEMDGCIVCHAPHASEEHNLLTGIYPEEEYTSALPENYDLCFLCHDSGLMTEEITETATYFRNLEKNLHYLHMNNEKGRNCNLCHNIHGSVNEHLIATTVKFGNWVMPMEFEHKEFGGSCQTGCHERLEYRSIYQSFEY